VKTLALVSVTAGRTEQLVEMWTPPEEFNIIVSLMKQQFVVTHTIRQTEIFSLLYSWVTNTLSINILYVQKNCFYLCFRKNTNVLKCWSVKDLSSLFCLLCNCVSVGYDKLLFHDRCGNNLKLKIFLLLGQKHPPPPH
jgi:hypothetical protein